MAKLGGREVSKRCKAAKSSAYCLFPASICAVSLSALFVRVAVSISKAVRSVSMPWVCRAFLASDFLSEDTSLRTLARSLSSALALSRAACSFFVRASTSLAQSRRENSGLNRGGMVFLQEWIGRGRFALPPSHGPFYAAMSENRNSIS